MVSVNLSDTAILSIKGSDHFCIISLISKNEAINLLQNADLIESPEHYIEKKYKFFLKAYMKMEKTITNFGYIKIEKQTFHQHKRPISIKT